MKAVKLLVGMIAEAVGIYILAGIVASWGLQALAMHGHAYPRLSWFLSVFFEPLFVAVFGVW